MRKGNFPPVKKKKFNHENFLFDQDPILTLTPDLEDCQYVFELKVNKFLKFKKYYKMNLVGLKFSPNVFSREKLLKVKVKKWDKGGSPTPSGPFFFTQSVTVD